MSRSKGMPTSSPPTPPPPPPYAPPSAASRPVACELPAGSGRGTRRLLAGGRAGFVSAGLFAARLGGEPVEGHAGLRGRGRLAGRFCALPAEELGEALAAEQVGM